MHIIKITINRCSQHAIISGFFIHSSDVHALLHLNRSKLMEQLFLHNMYTTINI